MLLIVPVSRADPQGDQTRLTDENGFVWTAGSEKGRFRLNSLVNAKGARSDSGFPVLVIEGIDALCFYCLAVRERRGSRARDRETVQ